VLLAALVVDLFLVRQDEQDDVQIVGPASVTADDWKAYLDFADKHIR